MQFTTRPSRPDPKQAHFVTERADGRERPAQHPIPDASRRVIRQRIDMGDMSESERYASEQTAPEPITEYASRRGD